MYQPYQKISAIYCYLTLLLKKKEKVKLMNIYNNNNNNTKKKRLFVKRISATTKQIQN